MRAILEGRRGGLPGLALRLALAPFGLCYGLGMQVRDALYTKGILPSHAAGVPTICVGNLTAGGTGKTPLVIRLHALLRERGLTPAILTRGYGADDPSRADEARLYLDRCPDCRVFVHPDRVFSARNAIQAGANVLILDDGFQHRRLRRDLDIVVLDATCPFGGGLPLPAGLLREFPSALARAGAVVFSHADEVPPAETDRLAFWITRRFPHLAILKASHAPQALTTLGGESRDLASLSGTNVFAASGIGRPEAFSRTLGECGAQVVGHLAFADHHAYTREDLTHLLDEAKKAGGVPVVTEKDAVKLRPLAESGEEVLVLLIAMRLENETPLALCLDAILPT